MTLYDRITELCRINGISQTRLESDIGISKGSVSKWKTKEPRPSTLEKIASYFHVSVDYLVSGEDQDSGEKYYINEETAQMAQEIFENKELRLLFSAARDASPEDLKTTHDLLLALKRKERGHDDDTGA